MRGYLLDTNHVGAYNNQVPSVMQKLRLIPADWQIRVCTITLGEIEAGHLRNPPTDQQKRKDYEKLLHENFLHHALCISIHTRIFYAKLIAGIFQLYPPSSKNPKTEEHLRRLGVDINDVWICASAMEHNLTLVTEDNMKCIKDAAGTGLLFDCWL